MTARRGRFVISKAPIAEPIAAIPRPTTAYRLLGGLAGGVTCVGLLIVVVDSLTTSVVLVGATATVVVVPRSRIVSTGAGGGVAEADVLLEVLRRTVVCGRLTGVVGAAVVGTVVVGTGAGGSGGGAVISRTLAAVAIA